MCTVFKFELLHISVIDVETNYRHDGDKSGEEGHIVGRTNHKNNTVRGTF